MPGERSGAPSPRDATAASWVARGAALDDPGSTSADVVERAPGVQVTRSGGATDLSTASLRGASSAQTPVYLAGVRLNDEVTGTADLSTIPLFLVDRVEVYRGNAPGHADRLGLGGAIFFEPKLPARPEVGAGVEAGSHGHLSYWGTGSSGSRAAGATVAVRRTVADGDFPYEDDGGTFFDSSDDRTARRQNADHETWDAWSVGRWSLGDRGRVVGIVNAFARRAGVSGTLSVPARSARTSVSRNLAAISARVPCARSGCEVEMGTTALVGRQHIDDPARELGLLTSAVTSAGTRAATDVAVSTNVASGLSVRSSFGKAVERLVIVRRGAARTSARRDTTRLAVSAVVERGSVEASALGSIECHGRRDETNADACGIAEPSGRAGAAVVLADDPTGAGQLKVLGNVGRYARVPTLGETGGVSPFVRGNPALVPEHGLATDAGVRWVRERPRLFASAEAIAFARWSSRLIAYRRTSVGAIAPFNVGSARSVGAEFFGFLDALDFVTSSTSVTLLDPRDTTAGRELVNDIVPFQSRFVAAQTLELYRQRPLPAVSLDRAALSLGVVHRSSRFADPAGLEVLPSDTSLDAGVTTRWCGGHLLVALRVDNVLDARRLDVIGSPRPGRTLFVSAEGLAW